MPGPRKVVVDIVGDARGYKKATDEAVRASTGFGSKMETIDRKLQAMGKRGGFAGAILGGVGMGAGFGVFGLIERGVGAVVGAMGDAVQAAIEDERATAKLTQTIQANVRAWDGNLAAVDAAIKAGARLAFTDDEVRAGLNQLIPRTHDIAEANRLNALAMDLARAKEMSLEEAATLVGKAYSGQASALRRAGIAIKDTKDSTAALAELQAAVQGQATTYAQTTEGSMQALQIQVAELNETIGYLLLPTVKELANFANNTLTPAIDAVASKADILSTAFHLLTEAALLPLLPLKVTAEELSKHKDEILGVVDDMTGQVHEKVQQYQVPAPGAVRFFDPIVTASDAAVRDILRPWKRVPAGIEQSLDPLAGIVKGSVQQAKRQAERDMAELQWALTHPMTASRLRKVWRNELDGAYAALHKGQATGNEIAIAKARKLIKELKAKIKELDALTFSLTGEFHIGKKGAAQLKTYFSGLGEGTTGHVRLTSQGQEMYHKASGGPVSAGRAYTVGELGRELFVPEQDGTIISNAQLERMGRGGRGGDVHINVTVHAAPGANGFRIGQELAGFLEQYARGGGQAHLKRLVTSGSR